MSDHPPIDPEVSAALAAQDLPPASMHPDDIQARRAESRAEPELLCRAGAITVENRSIPGPVDGPAIEITILRPAHLALGSPGPGILYIHGGGMVLGSRLSVDRAVLDAVETGFVVVSTDYRLAPEHRYPAAVEDCYAALTWTAENAAELRIAHDHLVIVGSSAGGGLAAATALLARDRHGPALSHQVLFCPMLDDREITASSRELQGEGRWDRIANHTGWSALLGDLHGTATVSYYAAPARATDLVGLPAAFIDVGDVETFRDEDIDYAARLARAGVPVDLHVWSGGVHGFTSLAPDAAISKDAMETRRRYFARIAAAVARR